MAVLHGIRDGLRRLGDDAIDGVRAAGATAVYVADQMPDATEDARAGAHDAAHALQRLPSSTLQWLAASSVGLGTGLFLSGAPRVAIAAGMTPALVLGAAIVARSTDPRAIGDAGRRGSARRGTD